MYGRGLPPIFVGFLTKPSITSQPPIYSFVVINESHIVLFCTEFQMEQNLWKNKNQYLFCSLLQQNFSLNKMENRYPFLLYIFHCMDICKQYIFRVGVSKRGIFSMQNPLHDFFPSRLEDIHITREHAYYVVRYFQ